MSPAPGNPDPIILNLPEALGADAGVSIQCFAVYIPNKNKVGIEISNQRKWVVEALGLFEQHWGWRHRASGGGRGLVG